MRLILLLLLPVVSFGQLNDIERISTVGEAEQFARDNMWTEVVTLSKQDVSWIFTSEEGGDPDIGDTKVVRNSVYKIISDTTIVDIQFSVIDFDPAQFSSDEIDSIRHTMMRYYRRSGSFEKMVDHFLSGVEKAKRYSVMTGAVHEYQEFFSEDFLTKKKGQVYLDEYPGGEDYKYIVYIREDLKESPAFMILKSRLNDEH